LIKKFPLKKGEDQGVGMSRDLITTKGERWEKTLGEGKPSNDINKREGPGKPEVVWDGKLWTNDKGQGREAEK